MSTYSHIGIEEKWYKFWLDLKIFEPRKGNKNFSMIAPPPNITGILHMGHVLNCTIQDVLIRYHKMNGLNVIWIPGLDHAGIATENKVEDNLKKINLSKKTVGRDRFLEEIWNWKNKYGTIILEQFKKLGLSMSWDNLKFTMDEDLQQAVKECFIRLYEDNLIYRGDYMVNWSPYNKTALSDEELEDLAQNKELFYIKYKVDDFYIEVATTRPETIPADAALAVSPEDVRYKNLIGKIAKVPLFDISIPIISSKEVKSDFGSGILKVTPAHSFVDFEIGKENNLKYISILDEEANIINVEGYNGLNREEAHKKIVANLKSLNLITKIEKIESSIKICSRTGDIIEPRLSKQWFLKMKPLAEKAINAIKDSEIEIFPKRWVKVYYHWMENIKDWCISRQILWGHSIPAYYKNSSDEPIISREDLTSLGYRKETDVLDTWFSSWLWPFTVFGWPEETENLDKFFPTEILVTGSEIIFFWVARMIMASYKFLDKKPFSKVLFHGIVRDEKGRKMSKSLGNSPDPLKIIEDFGADTLRFAMMYNNTLGEDLYYSEDWLILGRNFCNKLWNCSKFIKNIDIINVEDQLSIEERWILSKFEDVLYNYEKNIEILNIEHIAKEIYNFFWRDFCDRYLEIVKVTGRGKKTLVELFGKILKLLHPIIPFITEEIWSEYSMRSSDTICNADFPVNLNLRDRYLEEDMDLYFLLMKDIRNIKSRLDLKKDSFDVHIKTNYLNLKNLEEILKKSVRAKNLTIDSNKIDYSYSEIFEKYEIYISHIRSDDLDDKLKYELMQSIEELNKIELKINNKNFIDKAPKNIIERDFRIYNEIKEKISSIEKKLQNKDGKL